MATMKVDATAENKPAYPTKVGGMSRLEWVRKKWGKTYKNQGGIQVSAIFLQKVVIVLVGFAFELAVELGSGAAAS